MDLMKGSGGAEIIRTMGSQIAGGAGGQQGQTDPAAAAQQQQPQ